MNCCRNSRFVVGEDDLKWVAIENIKIIVILAEFINLEYDDRETELGYNWHF